VGTAFPCRKKIGNAPFPRVPNTIRILGVICMILRSIVSVEHRLVTDHRTDRRRDTRQRHISRDNIALRGKNVSTCMSIMHYVATTKCTCVRNHYFYMSNEPVIQMFSQSGTNSTRTDDSRIGTRANIPIR